MEPVYKYRRTRGNGYGAFRGISSSGGMVNRYAFAGARGGARFIRGYATGRRRMYAGRRGFARTTGLYGRFGVPGRRGLYAPERKFLDTIFVNETILGDPTNEGSIVLMGQGSGPSEHIGQKILIRSIQSKIIFQLAAGEASTAVVKVSLVQDTQANGANATGNLVYSGTGPGPLRLRDMENSNRFKVLWEEMVDLDAHAGEGVAFSGDQAIVDKYNKCAIPIVYGGGEADISDIRSNNLFLVASMIGVAGSVVMNGSCRIRFTDN